MTSRNQTDIMNLYSYTLYTDGSVTVLLMLTLMKSLNSLVDVVVNVGFTLNGGVGDN